MRGYLNQYGVKAGNRVVVFTTNDSAYRTVVDLHDAGIDVAAVVDCRPSLDDEVAAMVTGRGIELLTGQVVARAQGGSKLRSVLVRNASGGAARKFDCDLLAVSGGWSPAIHSACAIRRAVCL